MNKVAGFLTLCLVVAVLRALVVALLVAMIIALLWSFISRPRETLVFIGTLTLFGLASAQPIALIIAIGIVALGVVGAGAWQRSRCRPPSTDQSEQHSPAWDRLDRYPPG